MSFINYICWFWSRLSCRRVHLHISILLSDNQLEYSCNTYSNYPNHRNRSLWLPILKLKWKIIERETSNMLYILYICSIFISKRAPAWRQISHVCLLGFRKQVPDSQALLSQMACVRNISPKFYSNRPIMVWLKEKQAVSNWMNGTSFNFSCSASHS